MLFNSFGTWKILLYDTIVSVLNNFFFFRYSLEDGLDSGTYHHNPRSLREFPNMSERKWVQKVPLCFQSGLVLLFKLEHDDSLIFPSCSNATLSGFPEVMQSSLNTNHFLESPFYCLAHSSQRTILETKLGPTSFHTGPDLAIQ